MLVAKVDLLEDFERFCAADPFVVNGIYATPTIVEWRPTLGSLSTLREYF